MGDLHTASECIKNEISMPYAITQFQILAAENVRS